LEDEATKNPTNFTVALNLLNAYDQSKQLEKGDGLAESIQNNPQVDGGTLAYVAQYHVKHSQWQKLETTLEHISRLTPDSPEIWYDLAVLKTTLGKKAEAVQFLSTALRLSSERLKLDPKARDLSIDARKETNLASLHDLPEFKKLLP
jgi:tetratricopeptide (TPR) repeat protein